MSKFREYKSAILRRLISPSMRFELREVAAWWREQLSRACLWRWEITMLPQPDTSPYSILYAGRKAHLELIKRLLGIENLINAGHAGVNQSSRRVLISEIPFPGAICVPQYLRAIVPLGRSIEEIMTEYDYKLRRSLLKQRPHYRLQQTRNDDEIDHADREMLKPFAMARHGGSANLKSSETVRRSALEYGRLDLLLLGDQVVACMLGNESIRKGKRYWLADRCGYPETIFSDPKQLSETNSINLHLAIERAIENGYDYCDFALCFARPDDGLLQYKRRRGAKLDKIGLRGYGYFYIRLPKEGVAQFLWHTPLFAVEHEMLTLHLGLPDGTGDEEFADRYRQMGFGGLSKIYVHCVSPPAERLLATLRSFYKHQSPSPIVETILST